MPRKGENIHKRKDGRWEARIILRNDLNQPQIISVYGRTYKEVKAKKMMRLAKQNTPQKQESIPFSSIIEEWEQNNCMNQKKSTQLKYHLLIQNHILPVLGAYDAKNINETQINQFLNHKLQNGRLDGKGGLSKSTVKSISVLLNSIVHYAAAKGCCTPFATKICKPIVEKKAIHVLDVKIQLMLEENLACDKSLVALGISIALNTGLRIGEICALKWEDIDLDNKVIHVRRTVARIRSDDSAKVQTRLILDTPKTKSSVRDIPITSKLLKILSGAKREKSSYFVVSGTDSFLSPRTFEYRYQKALQKHGIPPTNFHCLRHTFATRCIECDVDSKTLSEILGHANVSVTLNTYVHPSWNLKKLQLEKLSVLK